MNSADITTVKSILSQPQKIAIIPHRNPDGDAIGSCLALYGFLKKKGHTVHVVAPNDYPKFLKWMPENDTVINFERENPKAKESRHDLKLLAKYHSLLEENRLRVRRTDQFAKTG